MDVCTARASGRGLSVSPERSASWASPHRTCAGQREAAGGATAARRSGRACCFEGLPRRRVWDLAGRISWGINQRRKICFFFFRGCHTTRVPLLSSTGNGNGTSGHAQRRSNAASASSSQARGSQALKSSSVSPAVKPTASAPPRLLAASHSPLACSLPRRPHLDLLGQQLVGHVPSVA